MVAGLSSSESSDPQLPGASAIERARSVLAVIADSGGPSVVPAAEALAYLNEGFPPLPPPAALPRDAPATVEAAQAALADAAEVAGDAREAAQIALAGGSLRSALE